MRHEAYKNGKRLPLQYAKPFGELQLMPDRLEQPLHWRKPARIFVNSVSDLFHEDVPDGFIDKVFAVMAIAKWHTFQVLTKRADRMKSYCSKDYLHQRIHEAIKGMMGYSNPKRPAFNSFDWPIKNCWLGVSCENQKAADERIPLLLQTPAAVRFLSCEPLLGPIEFSDVSKRPDAIKQLGKKALDGIHWVIVGGESGSGARPFDLAWPRSILKQCRAAGVAYFFKQAGSNAEYDPLNQGGCARCQLHLRDKKGGDLLEIPEDLRVREFPK